MGLEPLSSLAAGCIAMALNSAAYRPSTFAARSKPSVRADAGGSLHGNDQDAAVRHVILPQALRIVLPSWSNELIYTFSTRRPCIYRPRRPLVRQHEGSSKSGEFLIYVVAGVMYLSWWSSCHGILSYAEARLRIPGLSIDERAR